jgi:hypothetical protein
MSIRWTKRPENHCSSCGNSWYPRGKERSDQCPRCGSTEVLLPLDGCLQAIWALISFPFVLALLAVRLLIAVIILPLRIVAALLRIVGLGIARVAPVLGRGIGAGAIGTTRLAKVSFPALKALTEGVLSRVGKSCFSSGLFVWRWIASAKEDLYGDADREVNPISLVAKLLAFTVASSLALIAIINVSLVMISMLRGKAS